MLRDGDRVYKIVRFGPGTPLQRRVYDLAVDPIEARNLYDPNDAEQARVFERLERKRHDLLAAVDAWAPSEPEKRALELMRRLGYVE
jgi:hypothetical protein